jgi:hypothetical protein
MLSTTQKSKYIVLPSSPTFHFLEGVMWASKAVKFGYKWHVANGNSINFFGGSLV